PSRRRRRPPGPRRRRRRSAAADAPSTRPRRSPGTPTTTPTPTISSKRPPRLERLRGYCESLWNATAPPLIGRGRFWHHVPVSDTPRSDLSDWPLDPEVIYLNHGAFGSCPRPVQQIADAFRLRFERAPMQFVMRDAESLIDAARVVAAPLMGADGEDLVFVQNATTAVCTVLA